MRNVVWCDYLVWFANLDRLNVHATLHAAVNVLEFILFSMIHLLLYILFGDFVAILEAQL